MQKLLTFCFLMFCAIFAAAQNKVVSGNVVDDTNLPLPGVTVVVQGTMRGTVTDFDGNYQIEVSEADTLRYSFIGLAEQLHAVAGQSVINVVLTSDSQDIDEVIVIAYGTAKKSSFTGAQVKLDADQIAVRTASNAMQSMDGRVSGVQIVNSTGQPGSEPKIRVRGFGSLSASNSPLIVVDGAPYEGNFSQINPQDIENITVLKDASASAIYGARGANGVVMITTKRGKTEDASVNIDMRWGANANAQQRYNVMTDPAQYYELQYLALYNSRICNGATTKDAHEYANKNLISSLGYNVYTVPEGQRLVGTNFKLNPEAKLGYSDGKNYYLPDDWAKEGLQNLGFRQEYNASVAAQTEKMNYYISFGYLENNGILKNSGLERVTTRLKADYQAKEWLKIGANVSYTYSNNQYDDSQDGGSNTQNIFYLAASMAPVYPLYIRNTDGSIATTSQGKKLYDYGEKRNFFNNANPLGDYEYNIRNKRLDEIYGSWQLLLTPISGLSLSANFTVDVQNTRANELYNPMYGDLSSINGFVSVNHSRAQSFNQQYLATYKKYFASGASLEMLLGYESYTDVLSDLTASNTILFAADIAELGNAVGQSPTAQSTNYNYATHGFFGRVQLDFGNRYYLSGSFRRDASSCFHPDNRWGTFGSFGGGWAFSEESFASALSNVGRFKLRASVGVQGNDNLGRESSSWAYKPYLDTYKVSYSGDPTQPFAVSFQNKGNDQITWETSVALNVGLDFDILHGKISGNIDYFRRKTTDLLYQKPVSNTLGYTTLPTNVGDMVNSGVELELNAQIIETDNFSWLLNLNATHLRNEITDLAPEAKENGGIIDKIKIIRVGGSIYNTFLPKNAGVDPVTGQMLYYVDPDNGNMNTTNNYENAKRSDLGSSLPWLNGGFGSQIECFGVDLGFQFSYQLGGKTCDYAYIEYMHNGQVSMAGVNWHADILNAWTPENPNTTVPRLAACDDNYSDISDYFLVSSSFLSLNNVSLGYSLPENIISKLKLNKLRIYATADNVFYLSARRGLDPRTSFGAADKANSSAFSYSSLRTIVGGLQISF